jgi:hypothetical protein
MKHYAVLKKVGIERTLEYLMISEHYGANTAHRSKVPLINHINEGLHVMNIRGASTAAKRAFCLHPIVQSDGDLLRNWMMVTNTAVNPAALLLAMEYRNFANQYLSKRYIHDIDEIALSPLKDVNEMLVADKIQNYKDFILYHKGTHPRSIELDEYFNNWLKKLGVENFEWWFEELQRIQ